MSPDVTSSQEMPEPNVNPQAQQPIRIATAAARNFRGVPEPGNYYNRPLMCNTWSQTIKYDSETSDEDIFIDCKSEREKELEETVKALKENLKAHQELLSQIQATSARSSELLGLPQARNQANVNNCYSTDLNPNLNHNNDFNNPNISNNCVTYDSTQHIVSSTNSSRSAQVSPKIVNGINSTQPVSSTSAESVKYRIIAENTGNNIEEPIEIQLAEEDGALNLNSSADSGRLEICLGPEENAANAEIKTEINLTQSSEVQNSCAPSISSSHEHFIRKRKITAEEYVLYTTRKTPENAESVISYQQSANDIRPCNSNSLLQTPIMHNRNSNTSIRPDTPATPIQILNGTQVSPPGEVSSNSQDLMISIGPNNTPVSAKFYESINWNSASIATRKLLMAVFERDVLASHSMTGKPSPAFKDHDKPVKKMLDPLKIADIIFAVTHKCNVTEKEVRNAITTKCADENKMMKLQMNKRAQMTESNKENHFG